MTDLDFPLFDADDHDSDRDHDHELGDVFTESIIDTGGSRSRKP